jgi:Hyaluronan mediated motility receptor C-terminal
MERQVLLGKSKNAEHEIANLSKNYASLLGHQNHKQKICHILKLKEENLSLKQVCVEPVVNRFHIELLKWCRKGCCGLYVSTIMQKTF